MKSYTSYIRAIFSASIVCATGFAYAALPTSPLTTDYTIQGSESLAINEAYTVDSSGVLNIGGNGQDGSLDMSYDQKKLIFVNKGIVNIGDETNAGKLTITGSYAGALDYSSKIIDGAGTWNISKNGTLEITGAGFFKWNTYIYIANANVHGKVIYNATLGEGYLAFNNLNLYAGASITSQRRLQVLSQGTWNVFSSNITAPEFRFTGTNSVLNLNCEDAFSKVGIITMDLVGNTGKINVGNFNNAIGTLGFANNTKLTINLADDKSAAFSIKGFQTKENTTLDVNATLVLQDFVNDYVKIVNTSNFVFDGNKISINGKNSFITIEGYLADGSLIEGDWFLVKDDINGGYFLNNTGAIPEPATIAAFLGIIAAAFAFRARRK